MVAQDSLLQKTLEKCPTGIRGLDEVTGGGLPKGRTSLVCGSAGCGKTTLAMEFLLKGAVEFNEPGVFISFEESSRELTQNYASMGYDLDELCGQKKLYIDQVVVERSEIEVTGEYDLEALFIRLGFAIDSIGAKRVVLDTIEALFGALPNEGILRAELRRLFRWLKDRGVTAIVTGEKGENTLTRHGLEEYVADCVIFLDHRVTEQSSVRRMRIIKYRGSAHGTDEYPFLIASRGMSVLPLTSVGLDHDVSSERVSSGIPRLDIMLDGGFYRGSSILLSGTAGTGKSSVAAHFADATCRRGERCLYLAFEEPPRQIVRNMRSIGIDLQPWIDQGLLVIQADRGSSKNMEMHLLELHDRVDEFRPAAVILDSLTALLSDSGRTEMRGMAARLTDILRKRSITGLFLALTSGQNKEIEESEVNISSLIDTWLFVRDIEVQGERNRALYVLKSRGMAHSNQIREFMITDHGVELTDVYIGPAGVLTGAARAVQEAREETEAALRRGQLDALRRDLERRRSVLEAQVATITEEFNAQAEQLRLKIAEAEAAEQIELRSRRDMAVRRHKDAEPK